MNFDVPFVSAALLFSRTRARHDLQANAHALWRDLSRAVVATRGHFALQETLGNVERHFWLSPLEGTGSYWHLVGLTKDAGEHAQDHRAAPQGTPGHGAEGGLLLKGSGVTRGRHSGPTKRPACSAGQEWAPKRGRLREASLPRGQ